LALLRSAKSIDRPRRGVGHLGSSQNTRDAAPPAPARRRARRARAGRWVAPWLRHCWGRKRARTPCCGYPSRLLADTSRGPRRGCGKARGGLCATARPRSKRDGPPREPVRDERRISEAEAQIVRRIVRAFSAARRPRVMALNLEPATAGPARWWAWGHTSGSNRNQTTNTALVTAPK